MKNRNLWQVILASSGGTLIEWYDFYIFGSLATVLASQFFPKEEAVRSLLSTLAIFGVGFVVRPFGALFFGRMGDIMGRKHTFLLTLVMMGVSTFAIGLVPGYDQIGYLAPAILLLLRIVQGLALGGEYGGAATYVAENAPEGRRGFYTSFIQTTATLGLFASLLVILATRTTLGEAEFGVWGWRIPFLLSSVLVVLSYFIRRKMAESPLFQKAKDEGKTSANPLRESFVNPKNRRLVLIALFGATAGQGVVWYTGQFYAMTFIEKVMNIQGAYANKIIAWALIFGTPLFIVFGFLSDRIGRKKIMMAGCLLAAILYVPIYTAMQSMVPDFSKLEMAQPKIEAVIDPVTKVETKWLVATGEHDGFKVTRRVPQVPNPKIKPETKIVPNTSAYWGLILLVFVQVVFVTMVYGPIAAFLVELFPTRIRYTSMSLPYHIGNGVFGGLTPLIGTALVSNTGNKIAGVWYPIAIAVVSFIVGSLLIKEGEPLED
ncbi:MAG: MFS transporter [Fimbriimonadaceae bacterium]